MIQYIYDDIIFSMLLLISTKEEAENIPFLYSGLHSISDKGREYLKTIAQLLVTLQQRPGFQVPDSISRQIARNPADELPTGE